MKKAGYSFFALSIILIAISLLGEWTTLGNYENTKAQISEKFNPGMVESVKSYKSFIKLTQKKVQDSSANTDQEKMIVFYNLVIDRFTRGEAKHNLYTNWLLFAAGQINPVFLHIYDMNLLISRGHSAQCDQSSYLLLRLALDNGIRARHDGLSGHVVMEAWYKSDWHMFDPDLEIIPFDNTGNILSAENLAKDPVLLEKYYGPNAAQIIGSRKNNTYVSYPLGARFEWKNNVLVYVEKAAEVLKYVIPLILLAIGSLLIFMFRKNRNS